MGRRSRKRTTDAATRAEQARAARARTREAGASTPAPDPAPARRRPRLSEAPPAPWSPFPLVELCILAGLVLFGVAAFSHGPRVRLLLAFGLTLITLASLELAVREHFSGYRSHTSLLAGASAVGLAAVLYFFTHVPQVLVLALALAVFLTAWRLLRMAFMRRAGGVGFRA